MGQEVTRMNRMPWFRTLGAAAALLLGMSGVAQAKPILQEDFSGAIEGKRGAGEIVRTQDGFAYEGPGGDSMSEGSYVEYDLRATGFNPAAGTLEFDLTRAEKEPWEALATFTDGTGERLATLAVDWQGGYLEDESFAMLTVSSAADVLHWRAESGDDYPYEGALLGTRIPRGRTVHVALAWGSGTIALYLDGTALPGYAVEADALVAQLRKAEKLVVGAQTSSVEIPGGAWGMSRSLIANVQLHDRMLAAAELAKPITPEGFHVYDIVTDARRVAGYSGSLVAGDRVAVTVTATPGTKPVFDVVRRADFLGKLEIDWRGWGVYLEEKTFFDKGEVDLRDVDEYRVFVSQQPIGTPAVDAEPLERLKVDEQRYVAEGLESEGAYYVAVFALMDDGTLRRVTGTREGMGLAEVEPGTYEGGFTVRYGDSAEQAVVVCRPEGAAAPLVADDEDVEIDTHLKVAVAAAPGELRADESSKARVAVAVTDANGDAVSGHTVRFLLATTSEYTGVVGGGTFADLVGGSLREDFQGETDLFGKVEAVYTSGFAAKTAIIVARDMESGDTGAAWVRTYIQASADIQLEAVDQSLSAEGYEITVTSSDDWLTADGRSQARISAKVTLRGEPVEGHRVAFAVASGTGSVRTVKDTTGRDGVARAVYTAGKKIGMVVVTATDLTADLSGSVSIELRSDAPAKIRIRVDPEKIPADGRSRADILVQVTDINDNPNEGTEVEFRVAGGDGSLRDETGVTDRRGEVTGEFVAGRTPGTATVELTVRSGVPTDEEIAAARDLALAVTDYDFF